MGVLQSALFTSGTPETNKKLEDCATGTPSEVASHFTIGSRGDHIRRVQRALAVFKNSHPGASTKDGRKIPDFPINGEYTPAFAKAVAVYKEIKGIVNFANRIDDIVGIKTIKSLDKDEGGPNVLPDFVIPVDPPLVFKKKRIIRRKFVDSTQGGGKLSQPGESGGDGLKDILNGLNTLGQRLTNPEALLGTEDMSQRQVITIDDSFKVNSTNITTTTVVTETPTFGDTIVSSTTTTELVYNYGPPLPSVMVTTRFKSTIDGRTEQDTFEQELMPRAVAEKSIIINSALVNVD